MLYIFRRETPAFEADAVEPEHPQRISSRLDVRRHIHGNTRSAAYDDVAPDLHELVHRGDAPDYRPVADLDMSRKIR